ncbi:MAG: bifunctional 3-deoxy-7-phosphoheptulonate synthase/chorismate mutase type II [Lentisphaerae bacterium]|nr:bifunctional 3-deoxy-7-phosphoheptulonate synthase/chorismate mutase type II [Lentisphaerota bacterium]
MSSTLNLAPLSGWGLPDTTRPIVIAGPCSAETEEQVMATARGLKALGIHIYRAGIWKPRTRPGSFEGVGSIGLRWLQRVKAETGMRTATEVANVKHVYEALKAGIDILWIGARTSVNPFAIQEIADALEGVDIPVLVKNPVNPDVDLWLGAVERLNKAGLTRLAALHRGFSSAEKSELRNEPQWQIPIEVRRRQPELPMFCDPSHIAGRRDLIRDLAQRAVNLDFHGLMIETHCQPDQAWSDASQQVTPEQLGDILHALVRREATSADSDYQRQLSELREAIDQLDNDLLNALARRMDIVAQIGRIKKANGITVLQAGRWDEIVRRVHQRGAERGLSEGFLDVVFRAIHEESISRQQRILDDLA